MVRALVGAAILLSACQPTITPQNPPGFPPVDEAAEVRKFLELVNDYREKKGCGRLQFDGKLATVALTHSKDMTRRNFFDHTNPDGKSPFDRMRAAGIHYTFAAENLALGSRRAPRVLGRWLESPSHRETIENCDYTHHGVGLYAFRWTHVFVGGYADQPIETASRR